MSFHSRENQCKMSSIGKKNKKMKGSKYKRPLRRSGPNNNPWLCFGQQRWKCFYLSIIRRPRKSTQILQSKMSGGEAKEHVGFIRWKRFVVKLCVSHSHVWSRSGRKMCTALPKDTAPPQTGFPMSPWTTHIISPQVCPFSVFPSRTQQWRLVQQTPLSGRVTNAAMMLQHEVYEYY